LGDIYRSIKNDCDLNAKVYSKIRTKNTEEIKRDNQAGPNRIVQ
jgi:hypothetical protein